MFFMIDTIDISSYADDDTPYSFEKEPMWTRNKITEGISQIF